MPTLIYETLVGSRAYNLHRQESDHDYKGIIVPPKKWLHSFQASPEQIELGPDYMRFEIRKFFRLAAQANPTCLELLWTDPEHHKTVTLAGQRLLNARSQFLSLRVRGSFGGYAESQLKRIRTHRSWLLEPPTEQPSRSKFGLPESSPFPRDQLRAAEVLLTDDKLSLKDLDSAEISGNFLELLQREKSYRAAKNHWQQFQTWKKQRNPVRAKMEAEFGYDTKHAMHLIRIQRMGIEALQDNTIQVTRPDREELLEVLHGQLKYEELMSLCESQRNKINASAEESSLPKESDPEQLDQLCSEVMDLVLSGDNNDST